MNPPALTTLPKLPTAEELLEQLARITAAHGPHAMIEITASQYRTGPPVITFRAYQQALGHGVESNTLAEAMDDLLNDVSGRLKLRAATLRQQLEEVEKML